MLRCVWHESGKEAPLEGSERLQALLDLGVPVEYVLVDELGVDPARAKEIATAVADAKSAQAEATATLFDRGVTQPGE